MIPVLILTTGTVNIEKLLIVVGAQEIIKVQQFTAYIPQEDLTPDTIYCMRSRFSAN